MISRQSPQPSPRNDIEEPSTSTASARDSSELAGKIQGEKARARDAFPSTGPGGCMPYAAWRADQDIAEREDAALRAGFGMERARDIARTPGSTIAGWAHSAGELPEHENQ